MKTFTLYFAALLLALSGIFSGARAADWHTDFPKALKEAKATEKPVLLDFTGSDWCPVCAVMEKETFTKKEFEDYAKKNLVLVRLDYPQTKALPPKLQAQNDKLLDAYNPDAVMPTFILLNKNGQVIWRNEGIVEGGPSGFIQQIEKAKK